MSENRCAIAIVGIAGRFPGARDVATFWSNLRAGVESIRRFTPEELEDAFTPDERALPEYVRARSILDDVDRFDAGFFGIHARDAERIDPQHRVFLECCWEALEDAGHDPATFPGLIGVYAGCSVGSYFVRNVLPHRAAERFTSEYPVGGYPELLGSGYDFLATRVAYKLDLRGPAMTVQAACATSLLSVAQASAALMARQADLMLAGGVSITFPQKRGYLHQAGGMVSSDGHCRTFDAAASGTVFGDGAGVVALKRLEDAVADGNTIYAVIRGFGLNNDGGQKIGYTAPSANGQRAAIAAAYAMAGFDPASIGYVECHGTATPLGDPIEVRALREVFAAAPRDARCILGSVKPNVGHLDIAAGITGLIKAALVVRDATIPPTLHFTRPNPELRLDDSPFAISAQSTTWPTDGVRRAGVSAFGVGGTNVHVALEEAPPRPAPVASHGPQLLVLSARSREALDRAREGLARHLRTLEDGDLGDVAWTLQAGRRAFPFRHAVVADSIEDAARKLEAPLPAKLVPASKSAPPLALLFPGQGAQYPGMGSGLYAAVPVFRDAVDRCARALLARTGQDIRTLLVPQRITAAEHERLRDTANAQVALFTIEYALATLWLHLGIAPAAMLGHSVGEFVAATLAGVFSLEDALGIVFERGRLMSACAPGAMLAVRLAEDELLRYVEPPLDLAAINAPGLAVLAGPSERIDALEARLGEAGVVCRRLHTSHAFHSAMMDPVVAPLAESIASVRRGASQKPYVSGVTGDWIDDDHATSPEYWARHCREPVRFAQGLTTLVESGIEAFVECGPGATLSGFARNGAARSALAVARSLPTNEREVDDYAAVLHAAGTLWTAGVPIAWDALHDGVARRRVSLPTYPFERTRYWLEPPAAPRESSAPHSAIERIAMEDRTEIQAAAPPSADRAPRYQRELAELFEEISGETIPGDAADATFLELGFDSLFLGRIVQHIRTRFGVSVTFRQLLGPIPTLAALAAHLAEHAPADAAPAPAPAPPAVVVTEAAVPVTPAPSPSVVAPSVGGIDALLRDQLQTVQSVIREQLAALQRIGATAGDGAAPVDLPRPASTEAAEAEPAARNASRFDAFRVVAAASGSELTRAQRAHVDELVRRTVARTPASKRRTQEFRGVLADPRVAAGFRPEWKEMVYAITCTRARGSRLWDLDGNEYIDLLNGFGQTAFGHSPAFVVEAVKAQLGDGFAIGPQCDLAVEAARAFCELTGNERMTFCNTGSEAVMAAIRVARSVTGRNTVVVFDGAYHGQFDEVLVKSARRSPRAIPVTAGIPSESVANMVVLEYGTEASLAWIREHAEELAAVIVEPVQSRHPALVPAEFLRELRAVTAASETALVFDEVVTGFRVHPGGMQAVLGIRADLATYGKVVGGGLPIGILAGCARFMDALDGGWWQYGDDSYPSVAPTFFAGTFVRHPLAMAAVLAVLRHLQEHGPALQRELTEKTSGLVARLNAALASRGIATRVESYASIFYVNFGREERLSSLLYYHLRNRGIYLQEGFPCFLTTAHTKADLDAVVAAFEASLDALRAVGIFAGTSQDAAEAVALTEAQTEIWLAAQASDEASCAFNESVTLRLDGALDRAALAAAWDRTVARHESLRAWFSVTGETMFVPATRTIELGELDASGDPQPEEALQRLVDREARQPFDLLAGPLVRATLVRLAPERHALVLTAHHIVCDGWSINVVLDELASLYRGSAGGAAPQLPAALSFRAYARQQLGRDAEQRARVERYWLDRFAEPVQPLELPADRPRPAVRSYRGATRSTRFEQELFVKIKESAARNGCTLFGTLLGAFHLLVGRLADRDDVVVGIPTAGQALLDDPTLVGHCVNFLPIRERWSAETTVAQLLASMKRTLLDAYEHQEYTLGTLVRALAPERDTNRVPLAEVQFNLERLADRLDFGTIAATAEPNPKAFVNFDLFLNVVESEDGLRLDVDYSTDLFDAATIDRWLASYRTILEAIVADGNVAASRIAVVPPAEHELLAGTLNATERDYPHRCLHELVDERAAEAPNKVAVRCDGAALSYDELRRRSNQLANELVARGVLPRSLVAVCLERSVQTLVALLAVMKAGCAYVPLDPAHPAERLRGIIADAEVAAIVVDRDDAAGLVANTVPVIDVKRDAARIATRPSAAPSTTVGAEDLAYVISTSGSTGKPKGVEITHRALMNLLCAMRERPGFDAGDTLLAVTTVAFDIAGLELYLPLLCGGTVLLATAAETSDGFALLRLLNDASVMQATPATWRLLLEAGFVGSPRLRMLCGGEALPRELADRLLAGGGELWNVYGPTETTIWSTCARIEAGSASITVGGPIANTQCYVLDRNDQLLPLGAVGQLHIGGDGVARGYLRRPDLTAERFIDNPFGPGRIYRTGDLARILPSGEIQVLGRRDHQVKLRGFRIELGEIEATLERAGRLASAAVTLREDVPGEPRLVAYYVLRPEAPQSPESLRELLARELPKYMIPTQWVELATMPLGPSGKLDRGALPAPAHAAAAAVPAPPEPERASTPSSRPAHTETEAVLAAICREVLHRDTIAADANILALGADSLQLFAITARANARGLRMKAKDLFLHPTIASLAGHLDGRAPENETLTSVAS